MHDFGGEVTPPYIGWGGRAGLFKYDCETVGDGRRQHSDDTGDDSSVDDFEVYTINGRNIHSDEGCGFRCLEFGRNPCWPTYHFPSENRRLKSSMQDLPGFNSFNHRRLMDEESVCSFDDLQMSYNDIVRHETLFMATETMLHRCLNQTSSSGRQHTIFACVLTESIPILSRLPLLNKVIQCLLDGAPSATKLANRPKYQSLLVQAKRCEAFIDLILLPYSGSLSDNVSAVETPGTDQIEKINEALLKISADDSEEGRSISEQELDELIKIPFVTTIAEDIKQFVVTWNISIYFWKLGVQRANELPTNLAHDFFDLTHASKLVWNFERSRLGANKEGYSGFTDAWRGALEDQMLEDARMRAETCANVNLQVNKGIALEGSVFAVSLQISNGGFISMENILVDLQLSPLGNSTLNSMDLFILEETKLYNVSEIGGSGMLKGNTAAQVVWIFSSLPEASPGFVARYDVGGTLMYSIDGVDYLQLLSPDTITIAPRPKLQLAFFCPGNAYFNDPFPLAVEPSTATPFQLGLLIENRGYGAARDLNLVGSTIDILIDERGEPLDYTILQSKVGNYPALNTLEITFGNIQGMGNVVALWDIVSEKRGILQNYSAIFEYAGPIEGDSVSFVESTAVHELSHIVRVVGEHPAARNGTRFIDDGIGDFLANIHPDPLNLPDTVFSSDSKQGTFSVDYIINKASWGQSVWNADNNTHEILVEHNAETLNVSNWVYIRFDDPLGAGDYILRSVTRSDFNYELIPEFNSWQTSFKECLEDGRNVFHNHIHLFDLGVSPQYSLSYVKQEPASNLHIIGADEHSLTMLWDRAEGASSHYVVSKPAFLPDQYYKTVSSFTRKNSITISNLGAGTLFEVRVYSGRDGRYEKIGVSIVAQTFGISRCGDGYIDVGEECDDGILNGLPESNCTHVCVSRIRFRVDGTSFLLTHAPTESPAPTISLEPTSSPTHIPTEHPTVSANPTSFPSTASTPPSGSPTVSIQPSFSASPSGVPSVSLTPSTSLAPSSTPSVAPIFVPSESPTMPSTTPPLLPESAVCPESDSCHSGRGNFFWVSKRNKRGECRSRCVNTRKALRLTATRGFSCGSICEPTDNSTLTTAQRPTQSPVRAPMRPGDISSSPPTVIDECGPQDSCMVDVSGTQGYWMSFVLFGRSCARRCMRLEHILTAKDRGYVCGTECEGIPVTVEERNDVSVPMKQIQPQNVPDTTAQTNSSDTGNVFRRRPR